MSFLLDQGLPRSTVAFLRELGFASEHVGNLGMASARDREILEEARMRGLIVVTLDADFHALLALSDATHPSVIRIRIEGLKGDQVASILRLVHEAASIDLAKGAAITVTDRRIAIRRLPLISK